MKYQYNFLYSLFLCVIVFSCKKENTINRTNKLLHAELGDNAGIYDANGRFMILRGVNYNCLGDYWQANPAVAATKVYEDADFQLMEKYGFNCVRLLFSWSKLEPTQGVYDYDYIHKIQHAIEIADSYGMYVLVDMHQDAWGKYIATPSTITCDKPNNGWDGAPQWATITDGVTTCKTTDERESAPAVIHAFQNFWDNKNRIQTSCVKAWAELVKNICKYENVVGYDLLNEPGLGYSALLDGSQKMGRFYGDAIKAIRWAEQSAGGLQHIIFFENSVTYNGNGIPFIPPLGFTNDKNIGMAPHTYFESISYLLTIEQGYDLIHNLSKLYKAPMLVGEYGFWGDNATVNSKMTRFAKKEDQNFGSSTIWQWSQTPGDPHSISYDGHTYNNTNMALVETNIHGNFTGNINAALLELLSRPKPTAIAGKPTYLTSDVTSGKLILRAKLSGSGTTLVWTPERYGVPTISGVNIEQTKTSAVNGGYLLQIKVNNDYEINITY